MELYKRSGSEFMSSEKTRTRGRAALAFAAHPSEGLLAYGDNYGTFHAHRFGENGFGKATKIVAKDRKASRVEFAAGGTNLVIGGMGYLAAYSYTAGKFAPMHEVSISVRDFISVNDGELIFVNQGTNGVTVYQHGASGFSQLCTMKPPEPVQKISVSKCQKYLAVTSQDSANVAIYSISI
jgi:hypothetical protein